MRIAELSQKLRKNLSTWMFRSRMSRYGYDFQRMVYVDICRGKRHCRNGIIDTQSLREEIVGHLEAIDFGRRRRETIQTDRILPHHLLKIGVAGCPNACATPQIKDIGVVGQRSPTLDRARCDGCRSCLRACREGAITIRGGLAHIDRAYCLFCGDCIRACSAGALRTRNLGLKIMLGGHLGRHPQLAETTASLASRSVFFTQVERYAELFIDQGRDGWKRELFELAE